MVTDRLLLSKFSRQIEHCEPLKCSGGGKFSVLIANPFIKMNLRRSRRFCWAGLDSIFIPHTLPVLCADRALCFCHFCYPLPHDGHRRPYPQTKKEVFCSQEKTGSPGTGAERPACTAGRSQLPVLDLPGNRCLIKSILVSLMLRCFMGMTFSG